MPKFSNLPIYPRLHLFSFLKTKEAISASSVGKQLLAFQNTDLFWRQCVQRDFFCQVPEGINPKDYHAQRRVQDTLMLATFFKYSLFCEDSEFGLRCLPRCALILNEPSDFLELFNGLFNKIMRLYGLYFEYATDFPTLPKVPDSIAAFITDTNSNQKIEDYAAKLLRIPLSMELVSDDMLVDINPNHALPEKLPLNFVCLFASLKMWHKVRYFLLGLKQDELVTVSDRIGPDLVMLCIRFGNADELRWLFENIPLKTTGGELVSLLLDVPRFALNMEDGIERIIPTWVRNHEDHRLTFEQYQLLKERLQDDPEALALISTFSLNLARDEIWIAKKESISEYYANRIHAFHQFINLFLQQGVDPDFNFPQEDGATMTVRDFAREGSVTLAGSERISEENKQMLIGVLNALIGAQLQNDQELHSNPNDDDQQSGMKNRPGVF